MADAQMKFYIDIDGFSTASRAVQSLTNFIMENGSLYLRGEYNNTTHALDHMSGVVRMTTQPYVWDNDDREDYPTGCDVFIHYNNVQGPESDEYKDGIPDSDTKLVVGHGTLRPYTIEKDGSTFTLGTVGGSFNLSTTITPKIGDSTSPNTDDTVLPAGIPHAGTTTQICRAAVAGLSTSGNIRYDVQLRTPTFTVGFSDGNGGFNNFVDLHYKIGFCSINGLDSETSNFAENITHLRAGNNDTSCNIEIDGNDSYSILCDNTIIRRDLLYHTNGAPFSGFANAMLLPLKNNSGNLAGFMYARLCNKNGTLYNGDIYGEEAADWKCYMKSSEDDQNPTPVTADKDWPLTNQSLSGGFIQWVDPTPPL